MKRPVLLSVILLTGIALAIVLASVGSATHPGSQTLTLVERDDRGTFKLIDIRPRARNPRNPSVSPGDSFVGSSPLFDGTNTRRVGRVFFECTAVLRGTFVSATFLCDSDFRLSNGTLAGHAIVKIGNDPLRGAVIGGTRAYEGASGGFIADNRPRTTVRTFHFDTD
jgi:hypothetical protein